MNNRDVIIWLNSININNNIINKLEKNLRNLKNLWYCPKDELYNNKDISSDVINKIIKYRNKSYFDDIMCKLDRLDIRITTIYDKNYPKNLRYIYNPPKVLYYKGDLLESDYLSLSIVGSRKATNYGVWAAMKFANELSKIGITIVSGMAQGIDTYAHKGALDSGGRSIAVLGSGIDIIYPYCNKNLYYELVDKGAVLSEYFIGTKPFHYNFPRRNRIISGLSLGVVVIEAKEKSGTLITVEHAIEQGKEVFAVPGNINSIFSKGTNRLIKEGCKLVTDIEDIIEEIYLLKQNCNIKPRKIDINHLSNNEREILDIISECPIHIDNIIYKTGYSAHKVNSIITILELKGYIKKMKGNVIALSWT